MLLNKEISNLLYHHDCIIIPGFGGFVANQRAAFLNPAHHTFSPPSKKIAFNSSLRISDGLLANHISKKMNVSYKEAGAMIDAFVKDCMVTLNNGERLVVDKIGVLFYDAEKNLQFIPDNGVNYLKDSFGLTTIHSPAIKREEEAGRIMHPVRNKAGIQPMRKIKTWRLIELIPAAAILTWLMLSPPVLNNLNLNLGNLNPFLKPPVVDHSTKTDNTDGRHSYFKQEENKPQELNQLSDSIGASQAEKTDEAKSAAEDLLATPVPVNVEAEVKKEIEAAPIKENTITEPASTVVSHAELSTTQPLTHVIGGCFRNYNNALKYRDEALADGFHAAIIGQHKGLHMVSLFSSADAIRVVAEMALIKEKFQPEAWIFRK